jgi:hypothetical protein
LPFFYGGCSNWRVGTLEAAKRQDLPA